MCDLLMPNYYLQIFCKLASSEKQYYTTNEKAQRTASSLIIGTRKITPQAVFNTILDLSLSKSRGIENKLMWDVRVVCQQNMDES